MVVFSKIKLYDINPLTANRLLRLLSYFVIIAVLFLIWRIPDDNIVKYLPLYSFLGFQRVTIIIVIFTIFYSYQRNVNVLNFYGWKYFLFFILGFIFSFTLGAINNTLFSHIVLSKYNNSLFFYSNLKGIFLFVTIIVFFRERLFFHRFVNTLIYVAVFFIIASYFNFADYLLNIFGILKYEVAYETFIGITKSRFTFPSMDNNTFGGFLSGIFILTLYCAYKYNSSYKKFFYTIVSVFLTLIVFLGLGRANFLKIIISLIIFFTSLYGFKKKYIYYLIFVVLVIIFFLYTDAGFISWSRWQEIYYNIIPLIQGKSRFMVIDNFTWRLLAAFYGLPSTFNGWLFGTGGIQTGYVIGIDSASHIEYANWISQYGLITFIPLILFQFTLLKYFLKIKMNFIKYELHLLRSTGLALIVGSVIESLNSPLFINLWFWLAIISVIAIMTQRYINDIPAKLNN